jgi:uncharacterized protein YidB (DUF937 family)
MRNWLFALSCLTVGACSWVSLTPEGEKVRVLDASEVVTCKELGNTTVSSLAKVAGINRNEAEVAKELSKLARNAAVEMKGDTVVPITAVEKGVRTYAVYKCVGADAK